MTDQIAFTEVVVKKHPNHEEFTNITARNNHVAAVKAEKLLEENCRL